MSKRMAYSDETLRRFVIGLSVALLVPGTGAKAAQVDIAIVSRTVFYVPLWIAHERGFLEDEGIEPSVEIYNNAEKISEDLLARQVHIAISTPESAIVNAYSGGTLRIIGGNARRLPHFIIARSDIKTLAQLRGARFGVLSLNEGTTNLVHTLARVAGLGEDAYEILPVGGAPTRWRLLQENKIDVGLQPFPLSYEAEDAGFSNLGPISDYVPDYQFTSINVDITWARENHSLVVGFLRSLKRGHDYMIANPDEAAEIASTELRTSTALAQRALRDTARLDILSPDLSVSEPGLAYVFSILQSLQAISSNEEFDLTRILDDSYRAEAQ